MPFLALILVSLFWGGHAVVGKAVETQLAPLPLTVWRFTMTAVCCLPLLGRAKRILQLPSRTRWQFVLASLFWSVLYPLCYYQSLRTISPLESLLLVNTAPLLAVLFGFLVLRERLTRWEGAGIAVSFAGIVTLVALQGTGHAELIGIVFALCASASFAGYTVCSRSLFQALPLFDVLLATSVLGAVLLWIWTLVTGQLDVVAGALATLNQAGWMQLMYIVLIVSTAAYALYGYGLRRLPAAVSSALTFYPQVVFAAVIEWVWLGIVPAVVTWVGAAFILGGTVLMRIRRRPSQAPSDGCGQSARAE
ncbi:DMT family transporter [Alicyclobacillus cycloheptanicus]|nr:DMT family transporter [Alicyclobacillus cycloheptanicus]WDL99959.1 DMT family transporter [Alicyclobacillus cycloheptanicus]